MAAIATRRAAAESSCLEDGDGDGAQDVLGIFEQGFGHAAARDTGADDGDVGLLAERRGLDVGDGMMGWELPKRLGWVWTR